MVNIGFNISELGACYTDPSLLTPTVVICCVIFVPCVLGNIFILISILKFSFLRTKTHIVIGNLAISDLLVGASLIIEPLEIALRDVTAKYKYMCLLKYCFFMVSVTTSVASLLILSVERYMAIVFPFKHRSYLTKRKLFITIGVMWFVHLVLGLLPIIGWNNYSTDREESLPYCISDVIWPSGYVVLLMVDLTLGLALTTIIYISVIYVAIRKGKQRPNFSGSGIHRAPQPAIKRKTKMIMCVFGIFAICWLPFETVSFLIRFQDTVHYRCLQHRLIILGFSNSAINWAIYGCTNQKFRSAFRRILKCYCCTLNDPSHPQGIRNASSLRLSTISSPSSS